ncbi:right-handed parallel beta-helix repeat-containing protein [Bacteroidota bacterium]
MKYLINVLALVLLLTSLSIANIIRVPQNVSTIQAALNSCSAGDTVLVSPGAYHENIIWPSTSSLCLMSEYGRDTTIIDGSGIASVIKLTSIMDSSTVISGFTIRNGYSVLDAGGIYCNFSSPIIRNNLIDSNYAKYGGGIFCFNNSNPTITGNIIRANTGGTAAAGNGGGIYCNASSPIIDSNIISYNQGYVGAGICCISSSSPTITNNEIFNNSATNSVGGICCHTNSAPLILNNSIQYNYGALGSGGIGCYYDSSPEIRGDTILYNETDLITGYGGGLDVYINSSPHIVQNIIGHNKAAFGGGISCYDNCNPSIDSNYILYNSGDGIYSANSSNPVIHYNNIYGNSYNSKCGVRNIDASIIINAENNWWGNASGPYNPVTNPGGQGDTVSNYVDYTPWLLIIGIKNLQQGIPNSFLLYQNYPNPFNPKTYIRFDVQYSSHVKLAIYDILGKEITTLVNERLRAGSYKVDWDGSGYPSGVYFYKLITNNFVNVKKMVLIK